MLSLVLSYSLGPGNSLVADSGATLLWNFFEDLVDLGKNVFQRGCCESGHLAFQMPKQEKLLGAASEN
jgi:hypothetical protein